MSGIISRILGSGIWWAIVILLFLLLCIVAACWMTPGTAPCDLLKTLGLGIFIPK